MPRHAFKMLLVGLISVTMVTAANAKPKPPPPPPPPPACDATLPAPDAAACAGYYTGNILNGSPTDIINQQNAIASLPGTFTWDGDWSSLSSDGDVITALTNTNQLDFGQMLYGATIIGAHFGNIQDNLGNNGNVSVFWLFDFGTTGASYVSLDHTRGFSNAALYTTGSPPPAVPEPATWAMMLLGFGAAGAAMRRRRASKQILQLA